MIISSRNLRPFLATFTYPIAVLAEKGADIVAHLMRPQLEQLIARGAVVGIGSKSRVKTLRANLPAAGTDGKKLIDSYRGDGPQYHYRENLGDTHVLVMLKRYCAADGQFYRWDHELTFADVKAGKVRANAQCG